MTRVLICLHSLQGGGAERVMVHVVNGLDRDRFEPALALGRIAGPYVSNLRADVPLIKVGAMRARSAVPALVRLVRRTKPDVVLSTAGFNLALLIARPLLPRGTRLVVREANTPAAFLADVARESPIMARIYGTAYRALYRSADLVICQSDAMLEDLVAHGVPRERLRRIYNPVDVDLLAATAPERDATLAGPRLVSVGRLSPQKGFDILLRAVALVRNELPEIELTIFGEGEERQALETLTDELGLGNHVRFPGFATNEHFQTVAAADLFVSSSRYEGFSSAMVESLAMGTPVLATDCPSANREIIRIGWNGWLVPPDDPAAFARQLRVALAEVPNLDREGIREDCGRRFGSKSIIPRYEAALEAD